MSKIVNLIIATIGAAKPIFAGISHTNTGDSLAPSIFEPAHSSRLRTERVRVLAREAGFNEAGLVALPYIDEERDATRFEEWVKTGHAETMLYLKRTNEAGRLLRSRVGIPFPWAHSVVVCMASYNNPQPRSTDPAAPEAGWIARYAWSSKVDAGRSGVEGERKPSDYHKILLKRMKTIEERLRSEFGPFQARAFVDTGPVVERALAAAAGLGWIGKNTCLIHPRLGSYGFLAVLVTSLEVEKEIASPVPDRCGNCRRCLDTCPTGALTAPHQMEPRRCIAYLTIEHRGAIPEELMKRMGRQVFGCDVCQDVCPRNRKAPAAADPDLDPCLELVNPGLEWLAAMDEQEFERRFNGSPLRRAGFAGFRRNVAIAMGNSGLERYTPWLEKWAASPDEGLRRAALWAGRLTQIADGFGRSCLDCKARTVMSFASRSALGVPRLPPLK
jgi:epoxyqueuosine reductase